MIDFTLGICGLSRDFPADTRRLGRKGRMRSRFSALFCPPCLLCRDGKGGKLSSQASKMLYVWVIDQV